MMLGIWHQMHINQFRACEMDFRVEGPSNNKNYCRPMVGRQEKCLNSRRSKMAKTVTF